ncbi:hypothetical protein QCA50_014548 [Cerrena zonata]|uniref:CRAL-TRIO domain-containing protein n=1 Tax=Cerrena zonata TaxID=2478898 RepID=A0AAW0FKY2_9APHY
MLSPKRNRHNHKHHEHAAVLKQFKEELVKENLLHEEDSIGTDDHTLLRFLRARQYNVKAAKLMWKNCREWRQNVEGVGIDELYRRIDPWDYPEREHVFNCWPLWFHKTDKKGRPLNIHFFGGINMPELYKHISPERHWQTVVVNAESLTREVLPATSRALGKPVEGTFVIVDLKGFSLSQFWQMKNLAKQSFQISQDYFPETMAKLAIVNAPSSFTTIWSFIKPWLAKETAQKVDILGSDYQKVLLELVDAENLPASLGGKCTCAEFGGCEKSNIGPWNEGRKERRERWLKGEGEIHVSTPVIDKEIDAESGSTMTSTTSQSDSLASSFESSPAPPTPPPELSHDNFTEAQASSQPLPVARENPERPQHPTREETIVEKHPETQQVEVGPKDQAIASAPVPVPLL